MACHWAFFFVSLKWSNPYSVNWRLNCSYLFICLFPFFFLSHWVPIYSVFSRLLEGTFLSLEYLISIIIIEIQVEVYHSFIWPVRLFDLSTSEIVFLTKDGLWKYHIWFVYIADFHSSGQINYRRAVQESY